MVMRAALCPRSPQDLGCFWKVSSDTKKRRERMGSGGHEKKTPSKPTGADDENLFLLQDCHYL